MKHCFSCVVEKWKKEPNRILQSLFLFAGSICCVSTADSYIMVIQAVVERRWWQNEVKLNVRRIYSSGWTFVLFSCLFGGDILIWPRVLKSTY